MRPIDMFFHQQFHNLSYFYRQLESACARQCSINEDVPTLPNMTVIMQLGQP